MPKTFRSGVDRDLITVKDGDDDINEIMMGLPAVTVSQRIQNSVTDSRYQLINHLKAHGCRTIGCPIPRPRVLTMDHKIIPQLCFYAGSCLVLNLAHLFEFCPTIN
jgi:hypothetical protein